MSVEPADLHAWLVEPCLRPLPPYSRSGSSHLLTTLATISQGRVFNSLGSYQVVCLRQNSSRNPRALHTHLFSLSLSARIGRVSSTITLKVLCIHYILYLNEWNRSSALHQTLVVRLYRSGLLCATHLSSFILLELPLLQGTHIHNVLCILLSSVPLLQELFFLLVGESFNAAFISIAV